MNRLLLLLFLFSLACSTYTPVPYIHERVDRNDLFFPLDTIATGFQPEKGRLNSMQNKWYSKHLFSMDEPVLYNLSDDTLEVYRYTNLGTWNAPYCYRVEKYDTIITITKRRSDGQGGYDTGGIVYDQSRQLTLDQWSQINTKVRDMNFFELKTHDQRGLDGSEWILEGYSKGKYHIVVRWTPRSIDEIIFAETCELFEQIFKEADQ